MDVLKLAIFNIYKIYNIKTYLFTHVTVPGHILLLIIGVYFETELTKNGQYQSKVTVLTFSGDFFYMCECTTRK